MNASERVELLHRHAKEQGMDYPSDNMIIEAIHDAEFDALHRPFDLALEHDQDMSQMRRIWHDAIGQSWASLMTLDETD